MIAIDFGGKVPLITGAAQGVGACLARTFQGAESMVAINHPGLPNTGADARALAAELNELRVGSAWVIAADASWPAEVEAMMAEFRSNC